ncbi:MAG: hypothetical protein QM778_08660 [Myxococcales bacterium]
MPLNARQRTRYARHLLLPEVGLVGQERLVEARLGLGESADPRAAKVAQLYLERAGVSVESDAALRVRVADTDSVRRLAGSPALEPAAAALAGALGAVEAIKEVLQLGAKGDVSLAPLSLVPEDV